MSASIIPASRHSETQHSCCYLIFCCWRSCFAEHRSLISTAPRAMLVTLQGYMAAPREPRVPLPMPLSLRVQPHRCRVVARLISRDTGLTAPSPDRQCQSAPCDANGPVCLCGLLGRGGVASCCTSLPNCSWPGCCGNPRGHNLFSV